MGKQVHGQRVLSKLKTTEKRRDKKYDSDDKVKKETELKKAYLWFVDVFGSFWPLLGLTVCVTCCQYILVQI